MGINYEHVTSFLPKGEQNIATGYIDSAFRYKDLSLSANFNVLYWNLKGEIGRCHNATYCGDYVYTGTLGAYRPFSKEDVSFNTSIILAYKLYDLFTPFISYARTNRALNVQEQFVGGIANRQTINVFLKPESSDTYQIGFNIFKSSLFLDNDFFGFKAVYFYSNIKNYIYDMLEPDYYFGPRVNGDANLQGIEMELNYTMQYFFTYLSYTHQESEFPFSYSNVAGFGQMFSASQFAKLPKDIMTLDLGVKFLDSKIIIGSIIKYTGGAQRISPLSSDITSEGGNNYTKPETAVVENLPKVPPIWDFYVSYRPIKNLFLKLEVQNIMDINYMDALYTYNSSLGNVTGDIWSGSAKTAFNNSARGRTFIANVTLKF